MVNKGPEQVSPTARFIASNIRERNSIKRREEYHRDKKKIFVTAKAIVVNIGCDLSGVKIIL